jgi:trehalose 6-phosphate phosphatase
MVNLLAKQHLPALEQFVAANVLLGFDYDGTLAPIARTPEQARMRASTEKLLADVARLYPCVVISGRSLDDVSSRLEGVPIWYIFGNHGLEPVRASQPGEGQTGDWAEWLKQKLPPQQGVIIEDKKFSLTIHYRQASDKRRALEAIAEALQQLPGTRTIGGNQAVNVLPLAGVNKGVALQEARRQFACDCALFVGDDATDEDAFTSAGPDRLLGLRIGSTRSSAARYYLSAQRDIDTLLEMLLRFRSQRDDRFLSKMPAMIRRKATRRKP